MNAGHTTAYSCGRKPAHRALKILLPNHQTIRATLPHLLGHDPRKKGPARRVSPSLGFERMRWPSPRSHTLRGSAQAFSGSIAPLRRATAVASTAAAARCPAWACFTRVAGRLGDSDEEETEDAVLGRARDLRKRIQRRPLGERTGRVIHRVAASPQRTTKNGRAPASPRPSSKNAPDDLKHALGQTSLGRR